MARTPSASAKAEPINLSGIRYQNWCSDSAPPVVMNPAADLHACIAWCWGEARLAHELAINAQCYEQPLDPIVDAIEAHLAGLEVVLDQLGTRTAAGEGSAAGQSKRADACTAGRV